MEATFIASEIIGADIVSYHFKPEKQLRYTAGQFIELTLPHDADERGTARWFTLSSSPTEENISVTTRISDSTSSFKRMLDTLTPSDIVHVSQPMGDFVLPMDTSQPLLFVVVGIGITPVRSMLKFLIDTNQRRDIELIYAARNEENVVFKNVIEKSGANLTQFLKSPSATMVKPKTLTAEDVISKLGRDQYSLIYLSGPEEFVEMLYKDIINMGVHESRLVTDYFQGYGTP